jgi:hypothetical protein
MYNYYNRKNRIGNPLLAAGAAAVTAPISLPMLAISAVISAIPSIIKLIRANNQPNPNDWQGWNAQDARLGYPYGTGPINWIINDGDSIQNESLNILQWIQTYGLKPVLEYNSHFNRQITLQDLINKLNRGGYTGEARQFQEILDAQNKQLSSPSTTTKAGMNMYVTLAIVGAGLFLLLKKKKK